MAEKPRATPEIVADEEAYAAHQVAVEVWGISLSLAAGRMCRWAVAMGADYDFCPPAPKSGE